MLIEQTIEKLTAMRLPGMAQTLRQWLDSPKEKEIAPGDLVGLLADGEWLFRENRKLATRLRKAKLKQPACLEDIDYSSGGPARYVRVRETGHKLGFITPLTHNFCELCNRVRLTCTGTLYMCLGQEDAADLRTPLRASEGNELLDAAISEAISRKPKGHDFVIDRRHRRPAVSRHMSVTGG